MRFKIKVRYVGSEGPGWLEQYEYQQIITLLDAEKWGQKSVDHFNRTLMPGEIGREFLGIDGDMDEGVNHNWVRQNMTSLESKKFGLYDIMKCERCGITGKKPMLGHVVRRDNEYKAGGFGKCPQSMILLKRRRKKTTKKSMKRAEGNPPR